MEINLESILVCPICRSKIRLESDRIICLQSNHSYPISHGVVNLRTGITKKGKWDLTVFEVDYRKKPFYKDVYEYAAIDKIPRLAEEYRYSQVKGRVVKLLKPAQNALILDLGCGNGYFVFDVIAHYLAQDLRFVGLDVAEPNIARLNQRIREEKKNNIIGLLGEAENLPFSDETFDFIICSEVMEHLYNPRITIKHAHRVLKKGGRLFITTPAKPVVDFWNTLFWLPVKMVRFIKGKPSPTLAYDQPLDERRFRNYLTEAGFKILRLEQNALMPHESYLMHIPFCNFVIKTGRWLEKHFKRQMSFAGLHYLIEVEK